MTEIKGHRSLSGVDVSRVNGIKDAELTVADLWRYINALPDCDQRWCAIAKTHFQEGFSALVRAITVPDDPFSNSTHKN